MSSSLAWEPVVKQEEQYLDDQLKFALRLKLGNPVNARIDRSFLLYLEALRDQKVSGALDLIEAIENHGEIHVKEVF